jgi:hypothetical protein
VLAHILENSFALGMIELRNITHNCLGSRAPVAPEQMRVHAKRFAADGLTKRTACGVMLMARPLEPGNFDLFNFHLDLLRDCFCVLRQRHSK